MVKVDNKETMRDLAGKFMKMNRRRGQIAVFAITLTCLLFTSLFTGMASMILSKREADMRQMMDSSHALAQNLTQQEYEAAVKAVAENTAVDRYGCGIFLGSGIDDRFGFSAEVRFADENLAESFQQVPTTGRLPQQQDEIAVGTIVLEALGVPQKLGEEITISYDQNPVTGEEQTDTFRLCGYWESDPAVMGQMIWVSEIYAQHHRYPVTEKELKNGMPNGSCDLVVWYKNLWNLTKKTNTLTKESGLTDNHRCFEVNPAYNLFEEDGFDFGTAVAFVSLIILAGYLIIYNIFNISIQTDIRVYGLLKNIGITGRQLKKIVRMQVWRLSAVGIPCGLLAGYAVGVWMAPSLAATGEMNEDITASAETVISANPVIFLAAALLTLVTVYLSVMQPCRLVEKVTPVEALRMAQDHASYRKMKKKRTNRSYNWFTIAVWNFCRNLKKGAVVMLSAALSLVVLNCIVMLVQGYDFDTYKQTFLASDFQIHQIPSTARNTSFAHLTPALREQLEACPYSDGVGYVYFSDEVHKMEPHLRKAWEKMAGQNGDTWNDYQIETWNQTDTTGNIRVHFMGLSQTVFEKLEWMSEPCSWEEFCDGRHILTDFNIQYTKQPVSYYKSGESFAMKYQSGKEKSYTVLGEAKLPFSLDYPYFDAIFITVMVPEEEFIANTQIDAAVYAAIDCQKQERGKIQKYLEDTVLKENRLLHISSSLEMEHSFQRYVSKYYMVGAALVIVLGLIGVMNFFNMMLASLLSRKKEFALLEAVGMTKTQCKRMLLAEGCMYLAGTVLLAVLLVVVCGEQILAKTLGNAFFFDLHLTIWPCLVLTPVMYLIVREIVVRQFEKMQKESVVERILNVL